MNDVSQRFADNSERDIHIPKEELDIFHTKLRQLKEEIQKVFIGSEHIVDCLIVAACSEGHVLLEGVPGIAKTTLVRAFSQAFDGEFSRIQFTPDLLPADIVGSYIPVLQTSEFVFREGPIFAHVVLADEINRAPARTQSALLEAMQEKQVTVEGKTHRLAKPFLVMATQNPVDYEGVYRLPEAQLDRFMMKLSLYYPSFNDELRVLKTHHAQVVDIEAVFSIDELVALQEVVTNVYIADIMTRYILKIVRFTREHPQVSLGASPRAGLALIRAVKARAIMMGRDYITPDDIRFLAPVVLAHRLILHPDAEYNQVQANDIIQSALAKINYAP